MNREQFEGNWKQIKGKIKEKWGKLTDDDLTLINGKRDQLVGRIQKRYGLAKEKAEEEISNWEQSVRLEGVQQQPQSKDKAHMGGSKNKDRF